jgi:hypothetical protein
MSLTTETATQTEADPTRAKPTTAETRIHWAEPVVARKPEAEVKPDPALARKAALEQKFEAMRARNWITERMVTQYQKHWDCTREAALERLLAKAGV